MRCTKQLLYCTKQLLNNYVYLIQSKSLLISYLNHYFSNIYLKTTLIMTRPTRHPYTCPRCGYANSSLLNEKWATLIDYEND
jgi:hypothetical protein